MSPLRSLASLLALAVLAAPVSAGESWTQFLGTASNATEAGDLPLEWSSDSDAIVWTAALPGPGSSSPVVLRDAAAGDRVFLTCYTGYGTEAVGVLADKNDLVRHLLCFSAEGEELWRKSVPARQPEDDYNGFLREHGYATNSPATDGQRVFVFHGKSGLFAYDLDGTELWSADLGQESTQRQWGSAASPVVVDVPDVGPLVVVNAAEESAAVYAFHRETGEQVWKAEAAGLTQSYATPRVAEVDGRLQLILPVPGEVWGLAADTGKLLWYAEVPLPGNTSPSATIHEGVAYVVGGRPGGAAAVKLGGKGDVTETNVLWTGSATSYVPSPVYKDGKLFMVTDKGIAAVVDAETGERINQTRLSAGGGGFRGFVMYASVLLAGDRLYAVTRNDGTFVLSANDSLETLKQNTLEDEGQFNATPVAVEGRLYLRSDTTLYAIGR